MPSRLFLVLFILESLFIPERYCKHCGQRKTWNDGLVMKPHGFICTRCLYETSKPANPTQGD